MGLENALRVALLLAPHIGRAERYWPRLRQAIGNGRLLEALLRDLGRELQFAPGEIVTIYGLLLDRPPEWIAQEATAKELIEALPVLDKVNDIKGLLVACRALGLSPQDSPPGRPE